MLLNSMIFFLTQSPGTYTDPNIKKCEINAIVNEIYIDKDFNNDEKAILIKAEKESLKYNILYYSSENINEIEENNIPKVGENINYLIYYLGKNTPLNYQILSKEKLTNGGYKVVEYDIIMGSNSYILNGDFKVCDSNYEYEAITEIKTLDNGYTLYFAKGKDNNITLFINGILKKTYTHLNFFLKDAESTLDHYNKSPSLVKKAIENVIKKLNDELLIKAYNNYTTLDKSILSRERRVILNYMGNKMGLEIYKRYGFDY